MTKMPFCSNILFDSITERVFALAMRGNLFTFPKSLQSLRTKNVQICVTPALIHWYSGVRLALQLLSQLTLSNRGLRGIRPKIWKQNTLTLQCIGKKTSWKQCHNLCIFVGTTLISIYDLKSIYRARAVMQRIRQIFIMTLCAPELT